MATTPILDHIVILVPYETLTNVPHWLTNAFTVLEGGRHADGVTENKLILLQDGVYFELIAFVPGKEEERKSHRWGARRSGHIIDWATTLHEEDDLDTIRERVKIARTGIQYTSPTPGGRIKPDGTELKWIISSPFFELDKAAGVDEFVGGEAPFWCLDRTPRENRVPFHSKHNVEHSSGALGVHQISISVRGQALFDVLKATYDALNGIEGTEIEEPKGSRAFRWPIGVLESVDGGAPQATLLLVQIAPGTAADDGSDASVNISLKSNTGSDSIGGNLGDEKCKIQFDLEKVATKTDSGPWATT
ncbi:hypothetical protein KVR01_004040 [Diaporthe batatas]|uniref:uncharacterized protein n=1 Tax=Diaporthe batatas TaxID=748121 RepID=UPI001D05A6DA|nr:uncharacterized protein KVR01_004040 [Diaporthe batatas]KAG8165488.1 hypothetical protein KVR01_004040 [Diaporthe batatas]